MGRALRDPEHLPRVVAQAREAQPDEPIAHAHGGEPVTDRQVERTARPGRRGEHRPDGVGLDVALAELPQVGAVQRSAHDRGQLVPDRAQEERAEVRRNGVILGWTAGVQEEDGPRSVIEVCPVRVASGISVSSALDCG